MKNLKQKISSNFIIITILAVLAVFASTMALLNLQHAENKLKQTSHKEILISLNNQTAAPITWEDLCSIEADEFLAVQKSNGKPPVERTFKGTALINVLDLKGVSINDSAQVALSSIDGYTVTLNDSAQVALSSIDGYTVTFSADEVKDKHNIWLVWEMDGAALDENSGPYMVVVRKDPFSQRWAKQLCEIIVK